MPQVNEFSWFNSFLKMIMLCLLMMVCFTYLNSLCFTGYLSYIKNSKFIMMI